MSKEKIEPTKAQQLATEQITGNLAVSAGAGSGKTRVLVRRFVHILKQGVALPEAHPDRVSAKQIVAITFTNKAATEMRERIREELRDMAATDLAHRAYWDWQLQQLGEAHIETIHALCNSMLHMFPVEAGLDPAFSLLEEDEDKAQRLEGTRDFLRQRLAAGDEAATALAEVYGTQSLLAQLQSLVREPEMPVAGEDLVAPYAAAARAAEAAAASGNAADAQAAANAKEVAVMSTAEQAWLNEQAKRLLPHWQVLLSALLTTLADRRLAQGRLTFDDLETLAVRLLTEHPQVRRRMQARFKHIMVDEFQDTNERQRELVYLLSGGTQEHFGSTPLFVVGDPKQSIYRFRGAEVGVFRRVRQDFAAQDYPTISMQDNFRTSRHILAADNEIFAQLMGEDPRQEVYFEPLASHVDDGEVPHFFLLPYEGNKALEVHLAEGQLVAHEMQKLHDERGVAYGDMAVLLRTLRSMEPIAAALRAAGIPYMVVKGLGFFERLEVLDLWQLLAFLADPADDLRLASVLRSPYFGLDDEVLTRLCLRARAAACSLWQALRGVATGETSPQGEGGSELVSRAAAVLEGLVRQAAQLSLPEICRVVTEQLQPEAVQRVQPDGPERVANVRKFWRLAKGFAANKQGTLRSFVAWVEQQRAMESKEAAATPEAQDAVQFMTIHQAKGLEFEAVFLPALDKEPPGNSKAALYRRERPAACYATDETTEGEVLRAHGLGIQAPDAQGVLQVTPVLQQLRDADKLLEQQERTRLLYVAMTRPKRYLYLMGALKKVKKGSRKTPTWTMVLAPLMQELAAEGKATYEEVDWQTLQLQPAAALQAPTPAEAPTAEALALARPLPEFGAHSPRRYNASSLQEYLFCPRRYFYRMVEQLPEYRVEVLAEAAGTTGAGGLTPAVFGELLHRALELYEAGPDGAVDEVALANSWQAALQEMREAESSDAPDAGGFLGTGTQETPPTMLRQYVSSRTFRELAQRRIQRERYFELELPGPDGETIAFNGVIDVLADNGDGTVDIVDYKTGHVPALDEDLAGYAFQLLIYTLAAERVLGLRVRRASLHYLRACEGTGEPYVWQLPDSVLAAGPGQVLALCEELRTKRNEADYTRNEQHCETCPYAYLCKP